MHDIFSYAEEVIVYLGEVPHHASMALNEAISTSTTTFRSDDSDSEKLEAFFSRCKGKTASTVSRGKPKIDYAFEIFCFLRLLAGKPDLDHLPAFDPSSRTFIDTRYQQNLFEGLRQLMRCRWWNRIWVIQEVVVPKTVTMVYGSSIAPWGMFVDAARWHSHNRSSTAPLSFPHEYSAVLAYFSRIILDIERMRDIWKNSEQTALLPLLRRFSGRKASDDRDKVYALLSLARNQTTIVPNYSVSVPTVFQTTVLDIIQSTKSLAVLAGDLGRKDRQDLPSWVPDWSAAYDDLDRRRADNTEHYNATNGSRLYVQEEGAKQWSGIRQYLWADGRLSVFGRDHVSRFNEVLGTQTWIDWLPDNVNRPSEETCLAAISNFYVATGSAACLENHGRGVIGLPGLHVDRVVEIGETAFSEEDLLPVVRSWIFLLREHFRNKNYDRSSRGLGDAFRRTLCADTVSIGPESKGFTTRRMGIDDHGMIATWCLEGSESQTRLLRNSFLDELFHDLGDLSSYVSSAPIPQSIDAAIRSATIRRTFYITEKGYIGLGPAKMRIGDHLYIILGGQTPFILRKAGSCEILRISGRPRLGYVQRNCFEVIGDSYTHGLMDGEAMPEFKKVASDTVSKGDAVLQGLVSTWQAHYDIWETCSIDLSAWKQETNKDLLFTKVRDHARRYWDYDLSRLEEDLERMTELNGKWRTTQEETEAKSSTQDLSQWVYQFNVMGGLDRIASLIKAAKMKVKDIEKQIADAEHEMDQIEALVKTEDQGTDQKGHVYLV
jgi:hypothetical protein